MNWIQAIETALCIWRSNPMFRGMDPKDLPLRMAQALGTLQHELLNMRDLPTLGLHTTDIPWKEYAGLAPPGFRKKARAAESFVRLVARRSSINWRMVQQVRAGAIYEIATQLQDTPGGHDAARTLLGRIQHARWAEVAANPAAKAEIMSVMRQFGVLFIYAVVHATEVWGITPDMIVREVYRKYGHSICRARKCQRPICICGPNKDWEGWDKIVPTQDLIQTVTVEGMAKSLHHCYFLLNWIHGPDAPMTRLQVELMSEYSALSSAARGERMGPVVYDRDLRTAALPQEEVQRALAQEVGDVALVWIPVLINSLGIPPEQVLSRTFEWLS